MEHQEELRVAWTINENLQVLLQEKYISINELGFLMSILPFLMFETNMIVNKTNNHFMTITDIANALQRERVSTSKVIKSLLNKGILLESIQRKKQKTRTASPRALYMNPELFYIGELDTIHQTVAKLVMNNDVIEKNGIQLYWKVYIGKDDSYGCLYERSIYNQLKQKFKQAN